MSKVLLQKIIEEILIKKICVHAKGFFLQIIIEEILIKKILSQKKIEEILIKKGFFNVRGSFTKKYGRNFDQKGSFLSKVYFIFLLVLFIFHKKMFALGDQS